MSFSIGFSQLLRIGVAVGLMVLLTACGLLGDDGEEEKFPEPPDRPNSAYLIEPLSLSGGASAFHAHLDQPC